MHISAHHRHLRNDANDTANACTGRNSGNCVRPHLHTVFRAILSTKMHHSVLNQDQKCSKIQIGASTAPIRWCSVCAYGFGGLRRSHLYPLQCDFRHCGVFRFLLCFFRARRVVAAMCRRGIDALRSIAPWPLPPSVIRRCELKTFGNAMRLCILTNDLVAHLLCTFPCILERPLRLRWVLLGLLSSGGAAAAVQPLRRHVYTCIATQRGMLQCTTGAHRVIQSSHGLRASPSVRFSSTLARTLSFSAVGCGCGVAFAAPPLRSCAVGAFSTSSRCV